MILVNILKEAYSVESAGIFETSNTRDLTLSPFLNCLLFQSTICFLYIYREREKKISVRSLHFLLLVDDSRNV